MIHFKLLYGLVFIFVLFSVFSLGKPDDDDEEEEEDRPRSCQKYIFDFVNSILNSVLTCLGGRSTFKLNNIFELSTRASCLLKCVLQEEGIIDKESGILDDIGAAFYFEEMFDEPVREIALPEAQQCFSLADMFQPKEYWCKSYLGFTDCAFRAILKGLIPYGGDCVVNPTLGIFFSVLKYLAPDSPSLAETAEEMKRTFGVSNKPIKCFDKNCTRLYEYKKVNGSQSVIIYDKDMNVLKVENRKDKLKSKDVPTDNSRYRMNTISPTTTYGNNSYSKFSYNSFNNINYGTSSKNKK